MSKRIITQKEEKAETLILSQDNFIMSRPRKMREVSTHRSYLFEGILLIWCIEGEATVWINHKEYLLGRNNLLLVMPSLIVRANRNTENTVLAGQFIGNDYLEKIPVLNPNYEKLSNYEQSPLLMLTDMQLANLMQLHQVMLERYRKQGEPYNENVLKGLVFAFINEILSLLGQQKESNIDLPLSRPEKITNDFFKLLKQHFRQKRLVSFYADALFLTPKYLSRIIKTRTGHTAQESINQTVIIYCKNLLLTTDKTILEISEEMNFSNPSFFGKFFKQYVGISPQRYRERQR